VVADLRHDRRLSTKASFETVDGESCFELGRLLAFTDLNAVTSPSSVESVVYKWSDPAQINHPHVAPPSIAYNVAAISPSQGSSAKLIAVNSDGAAIVAEMVQHHGYTALVFCSSGGVYCDSSWESNEYDAKESSVPLEAGGKAQQHHFADAYAWSKRCAEQNIMRTIAAPASAEIQVGAPETNPQPVFTCVRPMGLYGPGNTWGIALQEDRAIHGELDRAFATEARTDVSHVCNVSMLMADLGEATVLHAPGVVPPTAVPGRKQVLPGWAPKGSNCTDAVLPEAVQRNALHGHAFNVSDGLRVNHGVVSSTLGQSGFQCSWDSEFFITIEDSESNTVLGGAVTAGIANGSLDASLNVLYPSGELVFEDDEPQGCDPEWPVVSAVKSVPVHRISDPFKFLLTWFAAQRQVERSAEAGAGSAAEAAEAPAWWSQLGDHELCDLPRALALRVHMRSRVAPGRFELPSGLAACWSILDGVICEGGRPRRWSHSHVKECVKTTTMSINPAKSKLGYIPRVPCPAGLLTVAATSQRRGVDGRLPYVPAAHWCAMLCAVMLLGFLAIDPGNIVGTALEGYLIGDAVVFLAPYALCFLFLAHYREGMYAYNRATKWRQNAQGWWRRAFVFGFPFSSGVQEHAHSAHRRVAALCAAYKRGAQASSGEFDAGQELKDTEALAAFGDDDGAVNSALLYPAAVLTPLAMARCCGMCVAHIALTSGFTALLRSQDTSFVISTWVWQFVRLLVFFVLERAWFRQENMFL